MDKEPAERVLQVLKPAGAEAGDPQVVNAENGRYSEYPQSG